MKDKEVVELSKLSDRIIDMINLNISTSDIQGIAEAIIIDAYKLGKRYLTQ